MSADSQIVVPASFVALFVAPGRTRADVPRETIAARHEFCEDLATALTETASDRRWALGVTEGDVLERIHRGLLEPDAGLTAAEAQWVVRRLAELLDWPQPPPDPGGAETG